METKQEKTWGGSRKGAGRKPLDMVRLTVYVTRDHRRHVKFLDLKKSLSENMRELLDDCFGVLP